MCKLCVNDSWRQKNRQDLVSQRFKFQIGLIACYNNVRFKRL
jgi:hypothetical protein